MNDTETERDSRQRSRSNSQEGEQHGDVSLKSILFELRESRKDNMQNFTDIKQHMKRTDDRLDEAEGRIGESETMLHASIQIIKQLTKRQAEMQDMLIDQNARARRENLRFYSIREGKEGTDMIAFLNGLLKTTFGLPDGTDLGIMRAHRALTAKPTDETKPRSIVVKFGSYLIKEDILRKAWQKKELLCDDMRFYVDHDYPPEVMKKRAEYAEARKVLKAKKNKVPYTISCKNACLLRRGRHQVIPECDGGDEGYGFARIPGYSGDTSRGTVTKRNPAPLFVGRGGETTRPRRGPRTRRNGSTLRAAPAGPSIQRKAP